jgi:hypothetical protein
MKPRVALSISLDSTFNDYILYCNYYLNWKLSHAKLLFKLEIIVCKQYLNIISMIEFGI